MWLYNASSASCIASLMLELAFVLVGMFILFRDRHASHQPQVVEHQPGRFYPSRLITRVWLKNE